MQSLHLHLPRCSVMHRNYGCWQLAQAPTVRAQAQPHESTPGPSHLPSAPTPHLSSASAEHQSPSLQISRRIAAARAIESRRQLRPRPQQASGADHDSGGGSGGGAGGGGETGSDTTAALFVDLYAELLAGWQAGPSTSASTSTPAQYADPSDPSSRSPSATTTAAAAAAATAADIIATAYTDELLLRATSVSAVNRISQGDYRQVVLLGDAFDTRPFRLAWPTGTAIFLLAPAEAHAAAEAALASPAATAIAAAAVVAEAMTAAEATAEATAEAVVAAVVAAEGARGVEAGPSGSGPGPSSEQTAAVAAAVGKGRRAAVRPPAPRPPPGCLLRRVSVDLKPSPDGGAASLLAPLSAAGFRPDRLSVWGLQGMAGLALDQQDVSALLAEAAHCAAYASLLVGELPGLLGGSAAANALAEAGLLGAPLAVGTPDTSYGRWQPGWGPLTEPEAPQRWLFAAQQVHLSISQMDTYNSHSAAADGADEDFFVNFS